MRTLVGERARRLSWRFLGYCKETKHVQFSFVRQTIVGAMYYIYRSIRMYNSFQLIIH